MTEDNLIQPVDEYFSIVISESVTARNLRPNLKSQNAVIKHKLNLKPIILSLTLTYLIKMQFPVRYNKPRF
jgi:hypothetical protein